MKKLLLTPILALLIVAGSVLKAQDRADDYLGLPGDNLNLYAVMNLFQESKTLEEFERKLNEEDTRINNLDLNNDGYVDYINVTDHVDGNVHTIVLQAALGPNEKQDVAVFTVERFRDGSVQIQLVGDEALYGRNYVIEPISKETPNPGYGGAVNNRRNGGDTYIVVSSWPLISYMYDPYYVGWHSSWYWGYYPSYWHPWSPCFYHFYYGYHYNFFPMYYSHYHHYDHIRLGHYNDYYYNRMRVYSPTVVVNINKGNYRQTYSRPESRRDGEALYARSHSDRSSNMSRREGSVYNNGNSRRTDAGNNISRSNSSRRDAVSTSRPSREYGNIRSSRSDNSSRPSRESASSPRSSRESGAVRSSRSSGNSESRSVRPSRESRSQRSSGEVSTSPRSSRENMTMSRSYGSESRSYSSPSHSRSQTAAVQRQAPSYESRSAARSSSAPSRSYESRSYSAPSRNYQARSSSPAPSRSYSSGSFSRSSSSHQSSASVRSSGSRSSSGSSRTASSHSSGSSDSGRSRR